MYLQNSLVILTVADFATAKFFPAERKLFPFANLHKVIATLFSTGNAFLNRLSLSVVSGRTRCTLYSKIDQVILMTSFHLISSRPVFVPKVSEPKFFSFVCPIFVADTKMIFHDNFEAPLFATSFYFFCSGL